MKKLILFSLILTCALACRKRLDNFLFNPDNSITAYLLDDYPNEQTLTVGNDYHIEDSLIHRLVLPMEWQGESYEIGAIYVGSLANISTDTVILYCHGTKDHIDFYWPRQKLYANLGGKNNFGVLMFDYPGYGISSGKPTEDNMYASTGTALQWLKNHGLTNDRLIMMGFSLGCAPVCEITARGNYALQPHKIILEAPFASAAVMVQDASVLNLPSSYFVNLKVDNAEEIKNIQQPFLWIHGIADGFLNINTHGEVIFKNYQGVYREAVRVAGGDHENTPFVFGYSNYLSTLLNFIRK